MDSIFYVRSIIGLNEQKDYYKDFYFLGHLGIRVSLETWKWRKLLKPSEENGLFHLIEPYLFNGPLALRAYIGQHL